MALNRENRVRRDVYEAVGPGPGPASEVARLLEELGYRVHGYEEVRPGVVRVETSPEVTEDVAMTVGAATRKAVIAERFMHSPNLTLLRFYLANRLLTPPPRSLEMICRVLGGVSEEWQTA